MSDIPENKSLILFDGVCNFCNASVNFIIDRDSQNQFVFASLQSHLGQEILKKHHKPLADFDSLLLIQNDLIYEKSTAALMIAQQLAFPWSLFRIFLFLPKFFRDPFYALIAKYRYNIFGKSEVCRIPTPTEKLKILG
ncbi:MAG: thiol-disulfide oxidoreductase DCC family protein [Pseudobdellovibrionaceae bacterium]